MMLNHDRPLPLSLDRRTSQQLVFSAALQPANAQHNLVHLAAKALMLSAAATFIATTLALTGCASAPIPTEQLAVSKTAVDSATTAGGTEFAPLELKTARDKLEAANLAVSQKKYEQAAALAEEAQVDAKLAETKALSAKAQKAVAETQDNLRTLLQEINRNQTQQQPTGNTGTSGGAL